MIEGDHCKACGAVCTHEQLTLVDVNGTYVYQCQGMCKKTIDLSEMEIIVVHESAPVTYDSQGNVQKPEGWGYIPSITAPDVEYPDVEY